MPNPEKTYLCYDCGEPIVDHVFLVQRRRVRPLKEILSDGVVQHNPHDAVESFHAGVQVGPELDPHCSTCYAALPTVQELIDAYKIGLDKSS